MAIRIFCILSLAVLSMGCEQPVTEREPSNNSTGVAESDNATIKLGMTQDAVSKILLGLNAVDISSGMQATADSPNSNWMWSLTSPNVSLETLFENGTLVELNIWDWRDRKMTSYHHTMKHDEIALIVIQSDGEFQSDVIRTHNEADN